MAAPNTGVCRLRKLDRMRPSPPPPTGTSQRPSVAPGGHLDGNRVAAACNVKKRIRNHGVHRRYRHHPRSRVAAATHRKLSVRSASTPGLLASRRHVGVQAAQMQEGYNTGHRCRNTLHQSQRWKGVPDLLKTVFASVLILPIAFGQTALNDRPDGKGGFAFNRRHRRQDRFRR